MSSEQDTSSSVDTGDGASGQNIVSILEEAVHGVVQLDFSKTSLPEDACMTASLSDEPNATSEPSGLTAIFSDSSIAMTPDAVKSSNEILTELFSAFNAKPPVIPEKCDNSTSGSSDAEQDTKKERKSHKKKKKKSKHKKKHKREDHEHHKHSKRKHGSHRSDKDSPNKKMRTESCSDFPVNATNDTEKCLRDHNSETKVKSQKTKYGSSRRRSRSLSGSPPHKRTKRRKSPVRDNTSKCTEVTASVSHEVCLKAEGADITTVPVVKEKVVVNDTDTSIKKGTSPTGKDCEQTLQNDVLPADVQQGTVEYDNLKIGSVCTSAEDNSDVKKHEQAEEGELSSDTDSAKGLQEGTSPGKAEMVVKPLKSSEEELSSYQSKDKSNNNKKHVTKSEKNRHHFLHDRNGRSHSRSRHKSRSRSTSSHRRQRNDGSRNASRRSRSRQGSSRRHSRSRSRDRHREPRKRHNSRSPTKIRTNVHDYHDLREKIDKGKLLEIARKNAMKLIQQGNIPTNVDHEKLVQIKSGGKSVEELTNFCKQLVSQEGREEELCFSSGDDSDPDQPFIHHPFQIKEKPSSIVMNVRNVVQLPVKTPQERTAEQAKLRLQFPVSSGQHHRVKEGDWIPVSPKKEEKNECEAEIVTTKESVFPETVDSRAVDIGTVISQRLNAIRKLQENPNDVQALSDINKAQQDMEVWAVAKQEPGKFTGSTGARVLSQAELAGGHQAWAKKDQFKVAAPVTGGMGMMLLQKMGWRPGEGLGKNKEGTLEPLKLDVKTDKKGLTSQEEQPKKNLIQPVIRDLSGKHPVSALTELCIKRKWAAPHFDCVFEYGPDHKKQFLFKVNVNGTEYKPAIASGTKKLAKACAAAFCLQQFGLLPKDTQLFSDSSK